MRVSILVLALAGSAASTLVGQTALAAPPRAIVLRAARLFDGKSDHVVTPGVIVVSGDKIVAVGKDATVPASAEVIDLGDATLLPGFMDAHTHLSGEATDDWNQDALDDLKKPIPERALNASVFVRKTIWGGFTTTRDLGGSDFIDVGLRNAIRSGKIIGPRMLVSVNAIGATGGHCDHGGYRHGLFGRETTFEDGVANGPDAIRAAVRFNVKYGADVIKVCATGGVLSETDDVDTAQLTQGELNALVEEAHALHKKAAAHAHGAEGAKRAIRAGIDSIEHGSFLDDEALAMMKQKGTYLVPTLSALNCIREKIERARFMPPRVVAKAQAAAAAATATFKHALARGVKIALGTDAAVCPQGRNAEEFHWMVQAGMKPADALRTGTAQTAQLLGIADKVGTLEAGKLADVVGVPGDPTQDIRQTEHVSFVMKDGAVVRDDRRAAH